LLRGNPVVRKYFQAAGTYGVPGYHAHKGGESIAALRHAVLPAVCLFTTVTDMFPKSTVASITGIGGMGGKVGSILVTHCTGLILKHFTARGNIQMGYGLLFTYCAITYVAAWLIMHVLVPKLKRKDLSGI
jgi:hypothetical protein